jgi:hypothetical protein
MGQRRKIRTENKEKVRKTKERKQKKISLLK